jgi:hypothetical protein
VPKSSPRRDALDSELVALFADDAEGLAIVDAIAATQRPLARKARRVRAAGLAAIAAAASVAVAVFAVGPSQAGVIDRALRVLGRTPVVHMTLVDKQGGGEIVDLRTGTVQQLRHRIDEWYDRDRQVRRVRDMVGKAVVSDTRVHVTSPHGLGRSMDSFIETYARALRQRQVTKIEEGVLRDRAVYWLTFPSGRGSARVAIGRTNLRPIEIRYGTREFQITKWRGAASVPVMSSPSRLTPPAEPGSLDETSVIASLRNLGLPPLRSSLIRPARGGASLELRYSNNPVAGRLAGRYLRVTLVSSRGAAGLTPVEASLAQGQLIFLPGKPLHAVAHVGSGFLLVESTLSRTIVISTARALLPRP